MWLTADAGIKDPATELVMVHGTAAMGASGGLQAAVGSVVSFPAVPPLPARPALSPFPALPAHAVTKGNRKSPDGAGSPPMG